jgi:hypothetical protein
MGQTVQQIEAQIDETRDRLDADLRAFWREIDGLVDWRRQYRQRPLLFLGAALAGGAALGIAAGRGSTQPRLGISEDVYRTSPPSEMHRVIEMGKTALMGLAAQRLVQYVSELIPGFEEHFDRAQQQAGLGSDPHGR